MKLLFMTSRFDVKTVFKLFYRSMAVNPKSGITVLILSLGPFSIIVIRILKLSLMIT